MTAMFIGLVITSASSPDWTQEIPKFVLEERQHNRTRGSVGGLSVFLGLSPVSAPLLPIGIGLAADALTAKAILKEIDTIAGNEEELYHLMETLQSKGDSASRWATGFIVASVISFALSALFILPAGLNIVNSSLLSFFLPL